MTKTVHGVVHGRTIEVEEELGVAEGQHVELQVRIVADRAAWGDYIRRSAGGWAGYPEMDSIMETIQRERKTRTPITIACDPLGVFSDAAIAQHRELPGILAPFSPGTPGEKGRDEGAAPSLEGPSPLTIRPGPTGYQPLAHPP